MKVRYDNDGKKHFQCSVFFLWPVKTTAAKQITLKSYLKTNESNQKTGQS